MLSDLLDSPNAIPVLCGAAALFAWVAVMAFVQWRKVRVAAYNARLKQVMIERGMSAAEIKSVLEAGGDFRNPTR